MIQGKSIGDAVMDFEGYHMVVKPLGLLHFYVCPGDILLENKGFGSVCSENSWVSDGIEKLLKVS